MRYVGQINLVYLLEKPQKKVTFLMVVPLRKIDDFFIKKFPTAKVPTTLKFEGGGVKALMALAHKKYYFCGFPKYPNFTFILSFLIFRRH